MTGRAKCIDCQSSFFSKQAEEQTIQLVSCTDDYLLAKIDSAAKRQNVRTCVDAVNKLTL